MLCLCLVICGLPAFAQNEGDALLLPVFASIDSVELRTTPMYFEYGGTKETNDIEVAFVNGVTVCDMLNRVEELFDCDGYHLSCDKLEDGFDILLLSRENTSNIAIMDFDGSTISFTDYNAFTANCGAANPLDVVEGIDPNGGSDLYLFDHNSVMYRTGGSYTFDLSHYGIQMFWYGDMGYLPLQCLSDMLLSRIGLFSLYSPNGVFILNSVECETGELYLQSEHFEKSPELTQFTYNELCMALDNTYGLREEHNITSFSQLFIETGLAERFLSSDPGDVYTRLAILIGDIISDGHSVPLFQSWNTDKDPDSMENMEHLMAGALASVGNMMYYSGARAMYYPDYEVPGYSEVGDTAILIFDKFSYDVERDYYDTGITNNPDDTIELIAYANSQIRREGSPIKNVVIDLTNNGGGAVDAAAALISWIMGSTSISLTDNVTHASGTVSYLFDANPDRELDENDYLISMGADDYHVYCLISPYSFSCANLVPAYLKASHRVTLIGRPTTGGACPVFYLSTADGSGFCLSGPWKMNTYNNGIFYTVEQGVEPHVYIDKIEHLYDREYLTELIAALP